MEFMYLVSTCRRMYICGVCVPCIYMQKDVEFVEFVYLVFTPMKDVPFVEFVYIVFTCRRMYRLWSLCTLYLHAERCTVCGVCVPCIYSHEGCTFCGVCVPCIYKQNGVQFV